MKKQTNLQLNRKTNNPTAQMQKWTQDLNRHCSREQVQLHLVGEEMQIKMIASYHFTPTGMQTI